MLWHQHSSLFGQCKNYAKRNTTTFSIAINIIQHNDTMDKLELRGRNLGRVSNSKLGHAFAVQAKWPNLKFKTQPKQLLGSLPLAFAFPYDTKRIGTRFRLFLC